MNTRYRLLFRSTAVSLMLGLILSACGGGGDSVATPSPTPTPAPVNATSTGKAPGETYTAYGVDSISAAALLFDVDGGYKIDNDMLTLSYPTAPGCSVKTIPQATGDPTACSELAGGQVFLLCPTTSSDYVDLVLTKASVVPASMSELQGLTLNGVSCGSAGLRATSRTFEVTANAVIEQTTGGSSFAWNSSFYPALLSATGSPYFDYRNRWIVSKTISAGKTFYLVINLYERTKATASIFETKVYWLQKP